MTRHPRLFCCLFSLVLVVTTPAAEERDAMVVVPPQVLTTVPPVHDPELIKAGVEGEVQLICRVDASGRVTEVRVVDSPHEELAAAAVTALRRWTFTPGTRNGEPGDFQVSIPFRFILPWQQKLENALGRPIFVEVEGTPVPAEEMPVWPMPQRNLGAPYPRSLVGSGETGSVVLDLTIDLQGNVVNPEVVRASHNAFVLPAIATALQLKFPPQIGPDGEPVWVNLILQYEFKEDSERSRRR